MKTYIYVLWAFSSWLWAITGGDPTAHKGGQFIVGVTAYPKSLLYYLSHDQLAHAINSLVFDSLLGSDIETNDFIPGLAKAWKVSPDKKTFTFSLDPTATFSDGTAVTAEDVRFTWETLMNPKNQTAPFQSYFESIESLEVKGASTVVFRARTLHFKNLEKLAGLIILPKHFFSKGNFNKSFHQRLLGSGPYLLDSVETGRKITLKRNPNYWAGGQPQNIGKYNFDRIIFKTTEDPTVAFEAFKRGDTDLHVFNIAKVWVTETNSPVFANNYALKLTINNQVPSGTQGLYWNLRNPLFSDTRVRRALAHLMNRQHWITTLFYDSYLPSVGIINSNSEYRSHRNKLIAYDPKKARELLEQAGWQIGADGVLVKGKTRFEFDTLANSPALTRYLTLYQEDLRKMGILMNTRIQDWPNFLKLLDDRKFDAVMLARSASIDPSDFGTLWGTSEANKKGSSNVSGFSNVEVDKLAAIIDSTFLKKERIPLVQRIDEIITAEQPYALTWEATETRLAYWNRFSFPKKGYFKYSEWWNAYLYWWVDAKKENALNAARSSGSALKH